MKLRKSVLEPKTVVLIPALPLTGCDEQVTRFLSAWFSSCLQQSWYLSSRTKRLEKYLRNSERCVCGSFLVFYICPSFSGCGKLRGVMLIEHGGTTTHSHRVLQSAGYSSNPFFTFLETQTDEISQPPSEEDAPIYSQWRESKHDL